MTSLKEKLDIERVAGLALDFFRRADNASVPGLFDLDPRDGYVRLGATRVKGELAQYSSVIRGLMNPSCDLQAVLSSDFGEAVLTVCDGGGTVRWQIVN